MLVALYFCPKDWQLVVSNLKWCIKMEGRVPFLGLVAYDLSTPPDAVKEIRDLAPRYFDRLDFYGHNPPPQKPPAKPVSGVSEPKKK